MRWTIRNKVIICLGLLMTIIGTLAFSGFQGVYSYRRLARSISKRAEELPLAEDLRSHTESLQAVLEGYRSSSLENPQPVVEDLMQQMGLLARSIDAYESELNNAEDSELSINDTQRELEIVHEIRSELFTAEQLLTQPNALDSASFDAINESIVILTQKSDLVPRILQQRMGSFVDEVRMEYRTWIVVTWITTITAELPCSDMSPDMLRNSPGWMRLLENIESWLKKQGFWANYDWAI